MSARLSVVILGLSITSSWGNGHATTYRGLMRELAARGHEVAFLERDVPWYAEHRDLAELPHGTTHLYGSIEELTDRFAPLVRDADLVIVGSYVPDGVVVGRWVVDTAQRATAFYDIDTPVTLAKLRRGECDYLAPELIPLYDLYLSFTGGPVLRHIEQRLGAKKALPLYCSVDPELYFPEEGEPRWDLGYMGTYSDDRQPKVEALLSEPARRWSEGRFAVVGPLYPAGIAWPGNVERIDHLPPTGHRAFYNAQRFTLNVTRADMVQWGWSPSVRLFEAAACGVPVISDAWPGLASFFAPGREILITRSAEESLSCLKGLDETTRRGIGERARRRVLRQHTAARRAAELESYALETLERRAASSRLTAPRPAGTGPSGQTDQNLIP